MRQLSTKNAAAMTQDCNCLALREAARYVTQHYDQYLVPTGLRATQFSIMARLARKGPLTINELAAELVMDRTTLGRNILPLERDGLIESRPGEHDRRRKELRITQLGEEGLNTATGAWSKAQSSFESAFGPSRSQKLRSLLNAVVTTDLRGDE
ncbi:MAG TPA: MarR family winged helix-turn-helix transcriptional regulator [Chloroflexota bacterium]|nr:MarR family winged helix-turn-helix transcriptional regulator [Chloroflexota bacterium]